MQGLNQNEQIAIYAVLAIAVLGLLYAIFLRAQILREDKGSARMQEVWGWIRDGADAYLVSGTFSAVLSMASLRAAVQRKRPRATRPGAAGRRRGLRPYDGRPRRRQGQADHGGDQEGDDHGRARHLRCLLAGQGASQRSCLDRR